MAVSDNSYGTVANVEALVPHYAGSGFDADSVPTVAQIEAWIDQISDLANTYLAEAGFTTPLSTDYGATGLSAYITAAVADLVSYANGSGRFYTDRALERGYDPIGIIERQLARWIELHAEGFEKRGASRTSGGLGDIATRNVDEAGDEVDPIFQRKGFGNEFEDWDS